MQIVECRAGAHLQLGMTHQYIGDVTAALAELDQAVTLADAADAAILQRLMMLNPATQGRGELAHAQFLAGHFGDAFLTIDHAMARARREAHFITSGMVLMRKAAISLRSGHIDDGSLAVEAFIRIQEDTPNAQAMWVGLMRGWLEGIRDGGSADRAVQLISDSITRCTAIGFRTSLTVMGQILAEILFQHGRLDEAARAAEDGIAHGRAVGELHMVPELLRLNAAIALARADRTADTSERAEAMLRDALRLSEEQGAWFWALRSATTLAEQLAASGRTADAEALLEAACARLEHESGDVADLTRARQLLRSLRTPPIR
jgi:tetratricopeptide (TPR) repeat protein